jgi:hypothetical protein
MISAGWLLHFPTSVMGMDEINLLSSVLKTFLYSFSLEGGGGGTR